MLDSALDFNLNTVLALTLAILITRLFRHLAKSKFWSNVWNGAKADLEDPNTPTSDPEAAIERALLDEQRPTIKKLARALRESVSPTTSTDVPSSERPTPQLVRKSDERD